MMADLSDYALRRLVWASALLFDLAAGLLLWKVLS
jgi:hypothetical protein